MSFEQFAATQQERVQETDEIVPMGGFKLARPMQLAHMVARIGKHGDGAGGERFRINIYTDSAMTKLYAQSEWSYLLDLEEATGDPEHWIGRWRFDFDGEPDPTAPRGPHLDAATWYYAGIEADGYERDGEDFYISWGLDWPEPQNTQTTAGAYALFMLFAGYEHI